VGGSWTLAWLPSFLSDALEKLLGELVILEHILETRETARGYVAELSVENQSRALTDLENLRSAKKQRLMLVLEQAYGLATPKDGELDSARTIERHLFVLKAGGPARRPGPAQLRRGGRPLRRGSAGDPVAASPPPDRQADQEAPRGAGRRLRQADRQRRQAATGRARAGR
jgi:hypothetical protein